jgi:hypothetical protein
MNANDILKYGDSFLMQALDGMSQEYWSIGGVCGHWSVKDILAHLVSYEYMLTDVLNLVAGINTPATYYERLMSEEAFNDQWVMDYTERSAADVLAEYQKLHAENMALIAQVSMEQRRRLGGVPRYGDVYDLEDFIVYSFYGHKREHGAQINAFKDTLPQA